MCAYRISFRFRHDSTVPRNKVNVVIDRKRRADFTLFFFFVIILHYYSVFLFFLLHASFACSIISFSYTFHRALLYIVPSSVSYRHTVLTCYAGLLFAVASGRHAFRSLAVGTVYRPLLLCHTTRGATTTTFQRRQGRIHILIFVVHLIFIL